MATAKKAKSNRRSTPSRTQDSSEKSPASASASRTTTRKPAAGGQRRAPAGESPRAEAAGNARFSAGEPAGATSHDRAQAAGEHVHASAADAPAGFGELFGRIPSLAVPAGRMAELQAEYIETWRELMTSAASGAVPEVADRRFAHEAWHDSGPFNWAAALYLMNSRFMHRMADAVEGDAKSRERVRFAVQQWTEMLSPANFLGTNPEAQRRIIETGGESLTAGLGNLMSDLEKGRMSQTDEAAFEVGRNVATSPGAVIFQNELIQLIQYAPNTPQVGSRPLLMVPPCINKFYILDLQPDNSMVAHAVAQGNTVFMLSWRNVGPEFEHLTWNDYLERGVFEAIRVAQEVSGSDTINALGFCVGGTLLATALAALAARGERPVAALTLMTTLIEYSDPGVLGIFIDEPTVTFREQTLGKGGILPGRDLAATFSFLRPNDLVWNYYVNNYLKGERPAAFDLLYWNADSTNLPGPMYAWYLRHLYLQNELRIPDRLVCAGQRINLGRIDLPTFVFGARDDHIVPWRSAYEGARLLKGPVQFVLGASGHIAGAINPASKNKRSYWTGPTPGAEAEEWLAQATEHPGSWWNEWSAWLAQFQGEKRPAPKSPGSREHRPIEPAPGSYVKVKAA